MNISPFPIRVQVGAEFQSQSGLIFDSTKYCIDNCNGFNCRKEYEDLVFVKNKPHFKECHKGFLICSFVIHQRQYVIHGMIDARSKDKNKRIFDKKYIGTNTIGREKISKFIETYTALDKTYFKNMLKKTNELIFPYHDIKRLVGTIVSNIEIYAKRTNPTMNLDTAVYSLDEKLKSIFVTSKLIDSYTSVVDALSSPESLKSGTSRMRRVYNAFHKMAQILESKAISKKLNIKFNGSDFTEIPAYTSLDLLPFIILDNAIKYSSEINDIIIYFKKDGSDLIVQVENTGCIITDEDKGMIFKRLNRGKFSSSFSSEGSGIGLYLAKVIAEHHNAVIEVESAPLSYQHRGIEIAVNIFTIRFKI
ncbi:MAG: sensor histidine kinase [Bacteriovoracaceae bacterium]|nr:sensor histidine kinase [Bacteriovoracaceae bacterium]